MSQRLGTKGQRAFLIVALKLCLSAAFFYWVWSTLPENTGSLDLRLVHPTLVVTCILAVLFQIAVLAFRWLLITQKMTSHIRESPELKFLRFFHLTWLSLAISQVLPALVGGDGFRIAGLRYDGLPIGASTKSVIFDRIFGLAGLLILMIPGAAVIGIAKLPSHWLIGIAVILLVAGVIGLAMVRLGWADAVFRHSSSLRDFLGTGGLALLGMAVAGHIFSVLIFQFMSAAYGIHIPFSVTVIVFPTALLMSILPISFGGWGVREASVIYGLSLYGISEHDALLASVIFGSFQICIAIPSVVGFFSWTRRTHQ